MTAPHQLDEAPVPSVLVTGEDSSSSSCTEPNVDGADCVADEEEIVTVMNAVVVQEAAVEEYYWPDGESFADFDVPMGHLSAPISWTVGYISETIQEAAEKGSAWARRRLGLPVLPRRGSMALRPFVAALADLLVASILKDRAAE